MTLDTATEPHEERHEHEIEAHAGEQDCAQPRRESLDRREESDLVRDESPGQAAEVGLMLGGMRNQKDGHHSPQHGERAEDDKAGFLGDPELGVSHATYSRPAADEST